MSARQKKGFTLIEILIVTTIIGILGSILFISVNSVREKAKAIKIIGDLKSIEKGLIAWGLAEGISEWWDEDVWDAPSDEPTIEWMMENTDLGDWVSGTPRIDADLYVYDNDGNTFDPDGDGCGSVPWHGVNLNIWEQKFLRIVDLIDKKIDGGDGNSCGRVVWDNAGRGGYFIGYRLGNNSDDLPF
jgi:prepilin-type N-terminal cleavage/methylation domain-containing protein